MKVEFGQFLLDLLEGDLTEVADFQKVVPRPGDKFADHMDPAAEQTVFAAHRQLEVSHGTRIDGILSHRETR
ncbi:hypothetical protein SDC9_169557 [bioreactor metagenome]|uniref:Uncharacterized protein n=1 Tax=bioreactor metagenome TaxID=1076179 RepID=A0A645GDT7_9ZZZZ